MINKKKYRNKPNYKKFCSLKLNVQNKQKLLKFKNAKWQLFLSKIRMSKKVSFHGRRTTEPLECKNRIKTNKNG